MATKKAPAKKAAKKAPAKKAAAKKAAPKAAAARGRGRPPKAQAPATRGRGRPPKAAEPAKRGRGRPPGPREPKAGSSADTIPAHIRPHIEAAIAAKIVKPKHGPALAGVLHAFQAALTPGYQPQLSLPLPTAAAAAAPIAPPPVPASAPMPPPPAPINTGGAPGGYAMTEKAGGYDYASLISAGWLDSTLIEHGYMRKL